VPKWNINNKRRYCALPHYNLKRQAKREALINEEDQRYRLRQFYMILLKADKARMKTTVQYEQNDNDGCAGK